VGLMVMALLISTMNFYLSFIRPVLFRRWSDYHFVSGYPGIGTVLVLLSVAVGWSSGLLCLLSLIALLMNTGGVPWFIIVTWSDTSLWDS